MPKIIEPILSPQDAAWGRQVNDRQGSLESLLDRFSLEQLATNKGVAGSVSSLQEQVRDLAGRVSYTNYYSNVQNYTSALPNDTPWGNVLTFTLTEPRRVSVEVRMRLNALARADTTTSDAVASMFVGVLINGAPAYSAASAGSISAATGGGDSRYATLRYQDQKSTPSTRVILDLPAGTHTVQGAASSMNISLTGTGLAYITIINAQIFVDVLQTTGA